MSNRGVEAIPGVPKPAISDRNIDQPADYADNPGHPMLCDAVLPPLLDGDHEHHCGHPARRLDQVEGVPEHKCRTCGCTWIEVKKVAD